MRWFSANGSFKENFPEFWLLKMILQFFYKGEQLDEEEYADPAAASNKDPRKELNALRATQGGLKLGLRLLTGWLHTHTRVFYFGAKATWSFYTDQRLNCKAPRDRLLYAVNWANGAWEDGELREHLKNCFKLHLKDMGLTWSSSPDDLERQQSVTQTMLKFGLDVASNRTWSMLQWKALLFFICILLGLIIVF